MGPCGRGQHGTLLSGSVLDSVVGVSMGLCGRGQ